MDSTTTVIALLKLLNEVLASAIVIIATSMLLYTLSRNLNDRVARTSALVLGCIVIAYACDILLSLGPGRFTYQALLRLQWIGIAFLPGAMVHLSDALLATTGMPSRGRRRLAIRIMYALGAVFLLLVAFTNDLIMPVDVVVSNAAFLSGASSAPGAETQISLRPGPIFWVYALYFIVGTLFALINVGRARQRCLTRATRRRMGYLQTALVTPAVGIFPFALLLGPGAEFSLAGLVLVNLANLVIVLMLIFLAYPLNFFGSRVPDRVVKIELLRFFLRGPATGVLALVTILTTHSATRIFGLAGQTFAPFAVVTVVLFWQWLIAVTLPYLERWLVYSGEDYERYEQLQYLIDRMLTRSDLVQLLEAILAAACDYLRVNAAFIATLTPLNGSGSQEPEVVSAIGARPQPAALNAAAERIARELEAGTMHAGDIVPWEGFWLVPLHVQRSASSFALLAIQARSNVIDLTPDEREKLAVFGRRASETLDDLALQTDIIAALEGLLPQLSITARTRGTIEYRPPIRPVPETPTIDKEQFKDQVRAALRHYWGGPGLTSSRLLELHLVQDMLAENEGNAVRALRSALTRAIEAQKPEGDRKLLSPEWTLYNILEMRFIKGAKVKEVGAKLAMSEADLYRKQRVAIDAVADTLFDMEQQAARTTTGDTIPAQQ